jgi:beta-lactamase superfamily II metal-dependent hydrolase
MVRLSYYNRHFMFTGDAGSDPDDGEAIAIKSGIELKSDVLKVGHHGSAYSSGRISWSSSVPVCVITTSNVTSTGHPHYSALQRLSIEQATVLQTKDYGTITFTTDGFDLTYASTKQP